jgi:hypothetical protein
MRQANMTPSPTNRGWVRIKAGPGGSIHGSALHAYTIPQDRIGARTGPDRCLGEPLTSDGTEHRNPMSPALPRDAEVVGAAAAQTFQGQHVIGLRIAVQRGPSWFPLLLA